MFSFTSLTLSEHWLVFRQPDFIGRRLVAFIGERAHLIEHFAVLCPAQIFYENVPWHSKAPFSPEGLPADPDAGP